MPPLAAAFLNTLPFVPQIGNLYPAWQYPSASAALAAAVASGRGGTVLLAAKTYFENLTINSGNICLQGMAGTGDNGGTVIQSGDNINPALTIGASAQAVTLRDLWLQGPNTTGGANPCALYINAPTSQVPLLWGVNVIISCRAATPGVWHHSGVAVAWQGLQLVDATATGTDGYRWDSTTAGQTYFWNLQSSGWSNVLHLTDGSDIRIETADLFAPRVNGVLIVPATGTCGFVMLSKVTIDSFPTPTVIPTGNYFQIGGSAAGVIKVRLVDCHANMGVAPAAPSNGFQFGGNVANLRMRDCTAAGGGANANGVSINGTGVQDFNIQGCTFDSVATGIFFPSGSTAFNFKLLDNLMTNCSFASWDIIAAGPSQFTISRNNYGGTAPADGSGAVSKYVQPASLQP